MNGAPQPDPPTKNEKQRLRRARLRILGLCINGPIPDATTGQRKSKTEHGPVVGDGGKCERCTETAKRSR